MSPHILPLLTLTILTACEGSKAAQSCDPSPVGAGTATVELEGESLDFNATWMMTGSSLQLNLEAPDSPAMLTLRLMQADDGTSIADLAEYPASFSLGDAQAASGTLYPPDGSPAATTQSDEIGLFELMDWGDSLTGCFSFSAEATDGTRHTVENGLINATER